MRDPDGPPVTAPDIQDREGERRAPPSAQPTLLADLLETRPTSSALRFALVGLASTAASAGLALVFRVPATGVFTVFLSAAALVGPLDHLLVDNRDAIWVHRRSAWAANRRTALCVLALFLGMTTAYVALAALLGRERILTDYHLSLDVARLSGGDVLSARFGDAVALFTHNLRVLGAVFALAFVFRTYGALLVLGWNAAVWGIVLTLLVTGAMQHTGQSPTLFVAGATLALLPHLLLEAASYVITALSAIFVSKGLVLYGLADPRLLRVARASGVLLIVALGALGLAAIVEQGFAPWLLGRLR